MTLIRPFSITALAFCLVFAGCTPTVATRGNLVSDSKLSQIQPLTSTKYDVTGVWGPPSAVAPFNPDVWYYIGETTEEMGILKREVVKRRVIEVTFDQNETVASLQEITPEQSAKIDMVDRKTATAGKEPSAVKQFLGNLGKFNSGGNDTQGGL